MPRLAATASPRRPGLSRGEHRRRGGRLRALQPARRHRHRGSRAPLRDGGGDIQDFADNATRFVALGRSRPAPTGTDRTSIVYAFAADRPGALLASLRPFADRGINLTKIESRPTKAALGHYYFLIDCEGHELDSAVAAALDEVRALTVGLRVLGSYPRAARPVEQQ